MEKPPAASSAEIEAMMEVGRETGKFAMLGFKKCFYPAIEKVKEIIERLEFALHVMRLYEAFLQPEGTEVRIDTTLA